LVRDERQTRRRALLRNQLPLYLYYFRLFSDIPLFKTPTVGSSDVRMSDDYTEKFAVVGTFEFLKTPFYVAHSHP